MAKGLKGVFPLFFIPALAVFFSPLGAQEIPSTGSDAGPGKAAIYIENGSEKTANEYEKDHYSGNVKSDPNGITITNLDLSSGDFTFTGVVASGAKSAVTLDRFKAKLGVGKAAESKDQGGSAAAVINGATLQIRNSQLQTDGALRLAVANYGDSKLIVNDSIIIQTGGNEFTSKVPEPTSNKALLIGGASPAAFSAGPGKSYYYNSTCTAEGWAALSTGATSGEGLDLFAYNTKAIAQHGGFGTNADAGCRVWLYGSTLESAEVGAVISKNGQIFAVDGASAPETATKYNVGKTTKSGTVITGGRNAVMIYAPDSSGQGKAAADCATLNVINSTLLTSRDFKSAVDYTGKYGSAVGAYLDYITGATLLIKSTSATIELDNAKLDSYSGVLIMTVLNSDPSGNFLAEEDGKAVSPISISMRNMRVKGDIRHMDYQRVMTLSLEDTILNGAVVSGTMEQWNQLWSGHEKKECPWIKNDSWKPFYGVQVRVGKGGVWNVSGESTLSALTIEDGGKIKGAVEVDGKNITPAAGQRYIGRIVVRPL